jgi:hypothetical protein
MARLCNQWIDRNRIVAGYFLQRSVRVAAEAANEARDAITAAQASADAANAHAQAAEEANRINREVLIASQRAWVRVVDAKIGSQPLRFDGNGASASIAFTIENIGNAPALNISVHPSLVVLKSGGPFPFQVQKEKCEAIRRSGFGGFTLFPNETHPNVVGLKEFAFSVNASKRDVDEGRSASPGGKYIGMHIVGCIDYTFPSDSIAHHQTGFIYELRKISLSPISPDEGVIDPINLRLQPDVFGSGRYAD